VNTARSSLAKRFVPSPAMIVALLALAVASAGTATARSTPQITPFDRVYQNVSVPRGGVASGQATCPPGEHVVRGGYSTKQGREVIPIAAFYDKDLHSYAITVLAPPGIRSAPVSVVSVAADCEQ
jgi:hypothetical protein